MREKHVPILREILKSTTSEKTIFSEARESESMGHRWNMTTGKKLEFIGIFEWKEPDIGEIFIPYGIEITDGVHSKTYVPIPDGIFRLRYTSGNVVFALLSDGTFTNCLTDEQLFPYQSDEALEADAFYSSILQFQLFFSYVPVEDEGIAIGEDTKTEEEISISQDALYSGTYIIGVQGSGKTSILTNIGLEQMWEGDSVIVLDPTGDMIRDIISRMPDKRIEDTYILSLKEAKFPFAMSVFSYPEQTKGVKLLELQQGTRNQIMTAFEKLWPETRTGLYFKKMLRNLIPLLLDHPQFTLMHIPRFLTDDTFREHVVSGIDNKDMQLFWQDYSSWSRSEKKRETQPFLDRLDDLLSDAYVKYIICQKQGLIDIRQAIIERKNLLVHLPLDEYPYKYAARTIGIFFLMQIYAATFSFAGMDRKDRPGFTLLVDEFSKWATGSADDFRDLFSFGRKYGIKQVLCNQYLGQLEEEGMGSLKQAMTTAHTVIALRTNRDDSPYLSHLFAGYAYEEYDEVESDAQDRDEEKDEEEEYTRKPTIIDTRPIDHLHDHKNPLVRNYYVQYILPLETGAKMRSGGTVPKYDFGFGQPVSFRPEEMQELLRRLNRLLYDTQVTGAIDEAKLHTFVYETCLPAIGSFGSLPYDMVSDREGIRKRENVQQQIQACQKQVKNNAFIEKRIKEGLAPAEGVIQKAVSHSQKNLDEWRTREPNIDWDIYIAKYHLGSAHFDYHTKQYTVKWIDRVEGGYIFSTGKDFTDLYNSMNKLMTELEKTRKERKEIEQKIQNLEWEQNAISTEKKVERTGILVKLQETMRAVLEALIVYPIAVDRVEVEREREKWEKEQERKRLEREKEQERKRLEREKQEREREANAHKVLSASDVAGILPKLENRHAFVKVASEVYRMKTIDLPASVGWEENTQRWNTILKQTKQTYCRGRKEVEKELGAAFTPQPDTNRSGAENKQTTQDERSRKQPDTQSDDTPQAKDLFDKLDEHEDTPDIHEENPDGESI